MADRARWIWFRPPPPARDAWGEARDRAGDHLGHLRATISLPDAPSRGSCRVTADGRDELWVNGTRVGRGPARSYEVSFDEYDITPMLRAGENVVAALVRHYGRPTPWWRPSQPRGDWGYGAFALWGEAACAGGVVRIATDREWRAREAAVSTVEPADAGVAFVPPPTEGPPPLEIVRGAGVPVGWALPGFDDSGWEESYVLASVEVDEREMRRRDVPHVVALAADGAEEIASGPAGARHPHPLAAIHGDGPGIPSVAKDRALARDTWKTFDFGRIVHAHPILDFVADAGTVLDLACGEDVDADGKPVTAPREWAMRIHAAGMPAETHESFEAVGFRYLSVSAREGSVARLDVRALERSAPRAPGASFSCSDVLLERIWGAGVRTVDLCSIDALVDCPGREQRAWLGDAYLVTLIRSVIDPDPALLAGNLRLHAGGARPDGLLPMVAAGDFSSKRETIPDHSLLWVAGLREHHRRTGDLGIVEELAPVAERALAWFERYRDADGGLANVPGWVFIDWAQLERGTSIAVLDAMYAWALEAFAELADTLGNEGSATRARARAARVRGAFERYWDPRRAVYVDAAGPGVRGRVSQQTNAMAIVAGCAPADRWGSMLDRVLDEARHVRTLTPGDPGTFSERMSRQWQDPPRFDDEEDVVLAQPFFTHFVHGAMAWAGRASSLPSSMRRWSAMLDRGNGCFEEYWDAEPGLGSRCHAWSATPVFDIATYVLGVQPVEPGMRTVMVDPCLGDLEWAQGAVATPHGFVHVAARRGEPPVVSAPGGVRIVERNHR